ncbi:hypothetical protein BD309DRAFT_1005227 [Dichomitus squalens]|uniref:Uncharacterized protein n=1 Tax=Dichomitus squalens TaxID=114155 RepID=A0A4Q9NBG0_9APHY|nr:hypothetical protein BD309DRAFT_1005227 [Dichomitus squalens]TBU51294.1 hypothetical protein BD310DRAFT_953330 [Dichomitus squalens]
MERRIQYLELEVEALKRSVVCAENEKQQTALLLKTRTAELQEAQVYLNKVDDTSDSEVVRCVADLNSGIFQAAAAIADAFHVLCRGDQNAESIEQASVRLGSSALVSATLLNAVRSFDHVGDSIVMQTTLQALIATYLKWLSSSWDFHVAARPSLLEQMYSEIREKEPQSVSGRWRALSRLHVKAFLAGDVERQQVGEGILAEHVTDVLLACGVLTPPQTLLCNVKSSFAPALHEAVRLALRLQKTTGEMIVSRDLSVVVAPVDAVFDPALMVDQWAPPAKGNFCPIQPHPVLCTTQLGLVREERREGCDGTGVVVEKTVLMKPTVVLASMLSELWNEHINTVMP